MKTFKPKELSFKWYSYNDILKFSALEITCPLSFDQLSHSVADGLYDLRMGAVESNEICQTCNLNSLNCPGHFGHIKLSRTVLNPLLFETLYGLLKSMCFSCKNLKITDFDRICYYSKLKALKKGLVIENIESIVLNNPLTKIEEIINNMPGESISKEKVHYVWINDFFKKHVSKIKCPRCGFKSPAISKGPNLRILKKNDCDAINHFNPDEIKSFIVALYKNESTILEEFFGTDNGEMFFMDYILVPPNRLRPRNFLNNKMIEHPQNHGLSKIIQYSLSAENDIKFWPDLQAFVYFYFDSSKDNAQTLGIKQILEKKEGLFRKNIMGKRVNYSARTVISPDPSLETREIGVPLVFASKLTFPEKVTEFNYDRLRQAVINGKNYPGCCFVENNGALINIQYVSDAIRLALANQLLDGNKVVWRHLHDGDVVLLNRQPTLHSVSLMTHSVRVLKKENTLRMHYVNCKSYNADFDGDEMNIHFPQSYKAISEAYEVFMTDNNYFVQSSGKPIRGLEQDHVVAAANMTFKDTFFKEDDFFNILSSALFNSRSSIYSKRIYLPEACIISPIKLYSGKQLVTSILKNLQMPVNFSVKCKIEYVSSSYSSCNLSNSFIADQESFLVIKYGNVLTGILDKSSVGATSCSLIHACGEIFGYSMSNELLTAISRVVNKYINIRGFTVRFDDMMMNEDSNKKRASIFQDGHFEASLIQKEIIDKDKSFFQDSSKIAHIDGKMRNQMNQYTTKTVELLKDGLFKYSRKNNMFNIVSSGAKGSMVNFSQISCALGQQELEGKRVPYMATGKTLPCFKPFESSPSAGGYVFERFLTGINPGTFYFHCMAGREGLIDTNVKTANSGYLQRCVIKHLESVKVDYDLVVRSNHRIIQYKYGEDGLDYNKTSFLENVKFLYDNKHLFKGYANSGSCEIYSSIQNNSTINNNSQNEIIYTNKFNESIKDRDEHFIRFMKEKYINSFIDPGRAVGVLAGQSIGEPSTQMTLNTFHLAGVGGKNVTLGIPRLKEILMVASKAIKTPTITVPISKNPEKLQNLFTKVDLKDCIESITVKESYVNKHEGLNKQITVIFELKDLIPECVKVLDLSFLGLLGRELKKIKSSVVISEIKNNEPAERSEEDENRVREQDSSSAESSSEVKSEEFETENDDGGAFLSDIDDEDQEDEVESTKLYNLRRISSKKYSFDLIYEAGFNVLLMPLLLKIVNKLVVKEIKGFTNSSISSNVLTIEGSDFNNLSKIIEEIDLIEYLNLTKSYSNDIHSVLQYLGVEAARSVIVQEIINVFEVYGIEIDIRHLYLIADYMTRNGTFSAFSRNQFSMDDSFITKMSFESCFTNLKNSALFHQKDDLKTPSAAITVGNAISIGTGTCELLYNLEGFCE